MHRTPFVLSSLPSTRECTWNVVVLLRCGYWAVNGGLSRPPWLVTCAGSHALTRSRCRPAPGWGGGVGRQCSTCSSMPLRSVAGCCPTHSASCVHTEGRPPGVTQRLLCNVHHRSAVCRVGWTRTRRCSSTGRSGRATSCCIPSPACMTLSTIGGTRRSVCRPR